jgi:hypothetical protein
LEKILAAMGAGSPRYLRVIFCVNPRYFPRQNNRAQVKPKLNALRVYGRSIAGTDL